MTLSAQNKISFVFILLFMSLTGMFFSAWNSYINQSGHLLIPVIFLAFSYLLIILLFFHYKKRFNRHGKAETTEIEKYPEPELENNFEVSDPTDYKALAARIIGNAPHESEEKNARNILKNLADEYGIMQGIFYSCKPKENLFSPTATYAYSGKDAPPPFEPGAGIHGQSVLDARFLELSNLPDDYTEIMSGLGSSHARFLYLLPFIHHNKVVGLVEFSVFNSIGQDNIEALSAGMKELGKKWTQLNDNET